MGVKIYDANTRQEITPEQARAQALDKRAYDQNYECAFADENLTLLTHELINAAEREGVGFICEQDWSASAGARLGGDGKRGIPRQAREGQRENERERNGSPLTPTLSPTGARETDPSQSGVLEFLRNASGALYVGFDVARKGDLSVITVVEDLHGVKIVRAILRMRDLRLPEQQARLGEICRLPRFHRAAIDMTGLGLGLVEYAQEEFGASRIQGVNFSSTVPATRPVRGEGRFRTGTRRERVRVTEALAMELLQAYEDRRIWHPADQQLRDDLRKPERITTPGGRVSIAATRDEAGHADHFWSFALALEAASRPCGTGGFQIIHREPKKLWL
jgi:phage FluMu gp28-like protein